ncbi:MAG: antibiotic biosynthesis monooxygenase [Clostridia bacterium]|nr:antibiotic biosynthesis monooxygenase [Clostridia bacterium]
MYDICVIFTCKEKGAREKFVERVKAEGILADIRAEKGCVRYDYYFADSDECELMLLETWESQADQQVHLSQPHMDKLRAIKGDYITSTAIKELQYN